MRPTQPHPLLLTGLFLLSTVAGSAQSLIPSSAVSDIRQTIGNRIEGVTILGGDHGAASGLYTFSGSRQTELDITKIGGSGAVASPQALGTSGIKWAPHLLGNIGYITSDNVFDQGILDGNRLEHSLFAIQAGAGARFYLGEHFSLAPMISGIYGHAESEWIANNRVGRQIQSAASGTLVDWTTDTWSVVPALDVRYEWTLGRTIIELSSNLSYFHTESFDDTSPLANIDGGSYTWENKLDIDIPLGFEVFGRELHTGGYFSRTEIGGDASDGLGMDYLHTVNGRLALDMLGTAFKLRWLGVGASYSWGENVDGWTAGVDVRFKF